MPEPITYKSLVYVNSRRGTVVSISKTNYGIEFTGGDVLYFPHAQVTA